MEHQESAAPCSLSSRSADYSDAAARDEERGKSMNDRLSESSTLNRESIISEKKTKNQATQRSNWFKYLIGDIYASDDPRDLSESRKNIIVFIVALGGVSGPLGSMIYMPGLLSVARDLKTSISAVNGSVAAFVVFMGVAPLIWASFSDQYGRKRMYLLSNLLSLLASLICAFSTNIGMLIVFRAFQSCGANAGLTLGAGVIADTIPVENRGNAYGFFYIGPLVGPVIGPIVGGFLCQYLGWQSTFFFQAILSGVLFILTSVMLPETLRKHKSSQPSSQLGILQTLRRDFAPMFLMLRDRTVVTITAYNAVIFASLYFLNPTITSTFQSLYGYNEWQVGLCYFPLGVGLMIGSIVSGRHSDYVLQQLKDRKEGQTILEMRLKAAIPSFFLIPAGYLIYGWTTQKAIAVYAPLIGLFVYALGQMSAFTPTSVYLVDSKPGSSATAVGVSNCFRSIVGAITSIFSSNAVDGLGPGILFTILAAINVANALFVILCIVFGEKWRTSFETKVQKQKQISKDIGNLKTLQLADQRPDLTDQEHMGEVQLARITSKHSAV